MVQVNLLCFEGIDCVYCLQVLEVLVLIVCDGLILVIDLGLNVLVMQFEIVVMQVDIVVIVVLFVVVMGKVDMGECFGFDMFLDVVVVCMIVFDVFVVEILLVCLVWVCVILVDGMIFLEKIMDVGECFSLFKLELLLILCIGNFGVVYFVVNGQIYGFVVLGVNVVKNVELLLEVLILKFVFVDLKKDLELVQMIVLVLVEQFKL